MYELATKYFSALEQGDANTIRECYSPGVRVWNTLQQEALTGSEHLKLLQTGFFVIFADRKFTEPRMNTFAGGFVRQHILVARRVADGQTIHLPICLVCNVKGGLFTLVEEYMNAP